MIPKKLENITEADLQELIDNSVQELKTKEYKRDLNIYTDSQKKSFLLMCPPLLMLVGGYILRYRRK